MKLLSFIADGAVRLGAETDRGVVDLTALNDPRLASMERLLQAGDAGMAAARAAVTAAPVARASMRVTAPLRRPGKIICVGLNYSDHAKEAEMNLPTQPILFAKYPNAIAGPGDEVRMPALTQQLDYEVELGAVIGKRCAKVSEADALAYVAGYTICNDVSARDMQFATSQWDWGKMPDTFLPLGPRLVTADEVGDPRDITLRMFINGEKRQEMSTKYMIFSVAYLIHWISQAVTLEPGDLISTGTPPGVGAGFKPPQYMKVGDVMRAEIDGIGTLENRVVADR